MNQGKSRLQFLQGNGDMASRIQGHDWPASIGAPDAWPAGIQALVRVMLASDQPMFMALGEERTWLYNDAFIPILGDKHPAALGRPALEEVWREARDILKPLFDRVFSGQSVHSEDFGLKLNRNGKLEDAYFTFSYTPITTENREVEGLFGVCSETTAKVAAQHRLAEAQARQRSLFEQAPAFVIIMQGPEHRIEFVNAAHKVVFNSHDWPGKTIREAFPSIDGQGFFEILDNVYRTGETFRAEDAAVTYKRSPDDPGHTRYLNFIYAPLFDAAGHVDGIFCEGFDVTDAKLSREDRRASEERLKLATEAAAIGTWDFNPVTGELKWDARCKALFGLPPEAEVSYDGVFLRGLHPDHRERTDAAVQRALSPHGPSYYDIEYRTIGLGDGVERWIAATGDALFENGRAVRFIGTVRDISDRKRADRRFELLNITAAKVAGDLNLDRIVQTITEAGVEMTGAQFGAFFYNVQDDKGEWYTLYALAGAPREAFARYPMPRNTAVFAPTFNGEGVVRSDDIRADPRYGHSAPYHGMPEGHLPVRSYLAAPVMARSGEVLGGLFFGHEEPARFQQEHEDLLIGVAAHASTAIDNARLFQAAERELAERRRVEAALNTHAQRIGFLDELAQATAAATDAREVLAVTTRMLGEHLDVDICAYADMEPDQDAFTIRGDWTRPGVSSIVGTYSLTTFGERAVADLRAGKPLILNDNIAEIGEEQSAMFLQIGIRATVCMPFIKQGLLTALMAIHTTQPHAWTSEELALLAEVTQRSWAHIERVRAVVALRELNATLERRVAEEVQERARAEGLLHQAQKMEAIGQLTGGIAHDFNNMLSVVVGGIQLTRRRLAQGNSDVDRYMEGALEGANRAAALTQRLLAFSRRQALAPEVVEANRLVSSMTELLSRTLGETIHVETVLLGGLWRTFADPVQLESAILNLSVNARDAMPKGGKLTIETANTSIDAVGATEAGLVEGEYVMISVTDTGEGMTPEVMQNAFDPFYTTKAVGKGSGLGLSQVFGFVRQSGGHVKLYSELGLGTSVKIYLPRYYGDEALKERVSDQIPAARGVAEEIILVVEDEERVRTFSSEALKELGYSVLTASNGREALSILESSAAVSLVFTDVVMPEMTGRELADAAKRLRPGLKVLFTTGYTRNAIVHNGVIDAGTQFLQKPFGIDQLAEKVRSVLDGA